MRTNIAALALLAGCGPMPTQPTDQQMNAANYGPPAQRAEQVIKAHYTQTLKDPDSAIFKPLGPPKQQWLASRADPVGVYGFMYCVTFNAKNAYGGYVGYKTDAFLMRGDTIVRILPNAEWGGGSVCP